MKDEIKVEDMNTTTKKTAGKKKPVKDVAPAPKVKLQKLKDLEGKFLLVKVGNPKQPATENQIKDVQEKLIELLDANNINCVTFVTHHAVAMEIIEKQN